MENKFKVGSPENSPDLAAAAGIHMNEDRNSYGFRREST